MFATGTPPAPPAGNPDQATSHRLNNCDTLRIFAALAVVVSHSLPLAGGPTQLDALWAFSRGQATIGAIAIQVFFIISGSLITASYLNTANPRRFLRARILRLLPALLVVLWLLAFLAGPLLTTLPLHQYFRSPLPYRAALGLSDHLPGVFTNNPFSSGIDGSLWTLRYEGLCYLAVLLLGLAGLLKRRPITALFALLLAARAHYGGVAILEFTTLFAAGAALHVWRPPLRASLAIACAIACLLALKFGLYFLAAETCGAYLVLYLALAIKLPNLAKHGDLSYGVYIYAWPIQQTVSLLLRASWALNLALTLPIVLALAWLSWHFVEAPALRHKNRRLLGLL